MATMIEKSGAITENFLAEEFRCKCGCGVILISEELVQKLQKLRDHFGTSITVSSGYRCPIQTKNVGSDSSSPHLLGVAADIRVTGHTSKEVAVAAEKIGFDGIAYINDNYLHLDLKGRRWYADERTGKTFKSFQPAARTLKQGMTGDDVRALQQALADKGYFYADKVDGKFGNITFGLLRAFQMDNNLTVDGICGPATKKALGI